MRVQQIEGLLQGKGKKIAIVVSRFNSFVTERLLEGAVDCLIRHGVEEKDVSVFRVPGAWEVPTAAQKVLQTGKYHGIVCLGAVIRGETPHFDYVAAEVSKGIASLSLSSGIPLAFGVLTTDTVDQAVDRAGTKVGNKGWDAALSVLEMSDLLPRIS